MLYNNLKALNALKNKGKKVGKLRYKKYMQFKSFILNQSGFKVIKTEYKAEIAGVQVVKVEPRGTSKVYKYGRIDRDYSASLNILERGLQSQSQKSGQSLPFLPVEMGPLRVIKNPQVLSYPQEPDAYDFSRRRRSRCSQGD